MAAQRCVRRKESSEWQGHLRSPGVRCTEEWKRRSWDERDVCIIISVIKMGEVRTAGRKRRGRMEKGTVRRGRDAGRGKWGRFWFVKEITDDNGEDAMGSGNIGGRISGGYWTEREEEGP